VTTVSELSESELVAHIQARLPPPPDWVAVGIGDDAAVVEPERNRVEVLSVDAIVEGVHFDRRFTPPRAIGHRSLAVNLSDLAAMGAAPRLALLSFGLPAGLDLAEFDDIVEGVAELAARHRVHVVGGNLTRSPGPLFLDVAVAGTAKRRQVLTRRGARPGDRVFVTGSIGAAAAGLRMLRDSPTPVPACAERYLYPEPRIRTGLLLGRNRAASACIDLSDGLADAACQIGAASAVGMIIEANALPIEPDARQWFEGHGLDAVIEAVTGGDDYELLFTVPPRQSGRLAAARKGRDLPVTKIGVCTREPQVVLRRGMTDTPMPHGYKHFG
jgi:thiamine-monophosphate kinase